MNGLYPAVVASYDGPSRTCRVSIPGITDGSDVLPQAVFSNPLGDSAATTEIRILAGDMVWVMFEAGDPRFPIITGYRTPRADCAVGWRRWHHLNMQLIADNTLQIKVGGTTVTVTDGLVDVEGADFKCSGNAAFGKKVTVGETVVAVGDISSSGGEIADSTGKTMSQMRAAYNSHAGHYDYVNTTPDHGM